MLCKCNVIVNKSDTDNSLVIKPLDTVDPSYANVITAAAASTYFMIILYGHKFSQISIKLHTIEYSTVFYASNNPAFGFNETQPDTKRQKQFAEYYFAACGSNASV